MRTASTAESESGVRHPWMTTFPSRLSTAAITCSGPTVFESRRAKSRSTASSRKEGRAHDDSAGAVCEHLRSALDAPDAAAHAAGKSGADRGDELAIVALALGRIQVDELYSREAREAGDPRFRVGCFDGEFLALHELDDVTVLEVDGGNQHAGLETNRDVMVAQVLLQL